MLGPKFTIPTIRHANRNHAGSRTGTLVTDTLLLLPEDDEPAVRRPGRHRRTERQQA